MQENEAKIQPYSKNQLAAMYNVSLLTLQRWLEPFKEEIGAYRGKCYTPNQVKTIFENIGKP